MIIVIKDSKRDTYCVASSPWGMVNNSYIRIRVPNIEGEFMKLGSNNPDLAESLTLYIIIDRVANFRNWRKVAPPQNSVETQPVNHEAFRVAY
jgi:hypothetical protein